MKPVKPRINLTGKRFGRLLVIGAPERFFHPNGKPYIRWLCRCDCGTEKSIAGNTLRGGYANSCGCLQRELTIKRSTKHGHSPEGGKHPLVRVWVGMKTRCYNPNSKSWKWYGKRGIKMCDGWLSDFGSFFDDIAPHWSPGLTVDRKDNDGNYSCGHCDECKKHNWPMNCRVATYQEQALNTRRNVYITYQGVTLTVSEWSRKLGWNSRVLEKRIKRGWTDEQCIATPLRDPRPEVMLIIDGISDTLSSWSKKHNKKPDTVQRRIKRGWSAKDALTVPIDISRWENFKKEKVGFSVLSE